MIYVLYGSDTDKSREKLTELVQKMLIKKPDASHAKLNDENISRAALDELIGGMGLFSSKLIVECDRLLERKDVKEIVIERLKDIATSENIFIVREGELLKSELKLFEKYAEKIQEFSHKSPVATKRDNSFFSIADALGRRDKKQLWVLYRKARMEDVAPEEIHGILFWQVKSMLLAAGSYTAGEAGLNPYVFQKSKGFARNFSREELVAVSSALIEMYHQARRGIVDFDSALERFIVEV